MAEKFYNFFVIAIFIYWVNGEINLYLERNEVNKLIGFDGDLYYVRDGNENLNAIQYPLLLAEHVKNVKFTWKDERPITSPLLPTLYSIQAERSNDEEVVQTVFIKTPATGRVPSLEESNIDMEIVCKDGVTDSTTIHLYINLTNAIIPRESKTRKLELKLTFKKLCAPDIITKPIDDSESERESNQDFDEDSTISDNDLMVYIIIGVTVVILIILISFVGYLHVNSIPRAEDEQEQALLAKEQQPINEEVTNKAITKVLKAAAAEKQLKELMYVLKDLSVRKNLLSIANTVQEGSFGRAYIGNLVNAENGEEIKVLVKTVTEHASIEQVNVFLSESSYLKRTLHHNVLPLMHVCFEDSKPPLVIYPYMNRGNLKNYLRLSRTVEPLSKPLTTCDIVLMALQIARGLQYIGRRRLIHKDVATRNCVVDEELHVKISDNALARDFFPGDYHCLGENDNRPVRWMAAETLENNTFMQASDVWSYGVLLWELSSLAQTPYANVDPLEMLKYLKSGLRLPQPAQCPDDFFTVMACCWALSPDDRPHFAQIIACLDAFLNTLNAFI